jgi:hypothetical protein
MYNDESVKKAESVVMDFVIKPTAQDLMKHNPYITKEKSIIHADERIDEMSNSQIISLAVYAVIEMMKADNV